MERKLCSNSPTFPLLFTMKYTGFSWLSIASLPVAPTATHYLDTQTNLRGAEPQWFLTGATTTCILRAEAIPGRVFHGFDAKTEVRPWDVMQSAGEPDHAGLGC